MPFRELLVIGWHQIPHVVSAMQHVTIKSGVVGYHVLSCNVSQYPGLNVRPRQTVLNHRICNTCQIGDKFANRLVRLHKSVEERVPVTMINRYIDDLARTPEACSLGVQYNKIPTLI